MNADISIFEVKFPTLSQERDKGTAPDVPSRVRLKIVNPR